MFNDSNMFWCIIGTISGAITSIIISLVFYLIGIKRKILAYSIITYPIFSNVINIVHGMKINYESNEIDMLFLSKIKIKNIGNSIIESKDFASSNPLSISTTGEFILQQSNEKKLFTLHTPHYIYPLINSNPDGKRDKFNHITLPFDYIPKKEEITCSLLYTGEISFNGVLKDGKIVNLEKYKKNKLLYFILYCIIIGLGLILGYLLGMFIN